MSSKIAGIVRRELLRALDPGALEVYGRATAHDTGV